MFWLNALLVVVSYLIDGAFFQNTYLYLSTNHLSIGSRARSQKEISIGVSNSNCIILSSAYTDKHTLHTVYAYHYLSIIVLMKPSQSHLVLDLKAGRIQRNIRELIVLPVTVRSRGTNCSAAVNRWTPSHYPAMFIFWEPNRIFWKPAWDALALRFTN